MGSDVNIVRNDDFSAGRSKPRSWVWIAGSRDVTWQREAAASSTDGTRICLSSRNEQGRGGFSQTLFCKPGEFYRVEATVSCDLLATNESTGFVLTIQPLDGDRSAGDPLSTPGLHRCAVPFAVRAVWQAPSDIRRVRLGVAIHRARGRATVHHVRFIRILEPDEQSHVLAIPGPAYSLAPPRSVTTLCICSQRALDRPITHRLRGFLGDDQVRTCRPADLPDACQKADALLLIDPTPPRSIRSFRALLRLAEDRIVIVSLPAFAKLVSSQVRLRRVEQPDDPIHARVMYAHFVTQGFALHDRFAYAWTGKTSCSFVQNQFRKHPAMEPFCRKHGLVTLLESECDRDVTSHRPICLFKQTSAGALVILDVEPAEESGSSLAEPTLAIHLLLSILGHGCVGLGQYIVPAREESEFRGNIREMADRFEHWVVHDADVPTDEVTDQLVTVGREDQSFGLPLKPKPVILVRSGLTSGDVESVYGAFLWFKQLVRPEPYVCPYAQQLASRFRLAWIACAAPWAAREGWLRRSNKANRETSLEVDGSTVAALIDVVSHPRETARVVLAEGGESARRCQTWLPQLASTFMADRYYASGVDEGEAFVDRTRFSWQRIQPAVRVERDVASFREGLHHDVLSAGGQVIRIEVPGCDADFTAHSIHRTDLTATLLEHVIGCQFGLIAVNRKPVSVQLRSFAPLGPGEAMVIDHRDPRLLAALSQAG